MNKSVFFITLFSICFLSIFKVNKVNAAWQEQLFIPGTKGNIEKDWIKDGVNGKATYTNEGMLFDTANGTGDAYSSILWTKQVFKGDVRLEYKFKRLNTNINNGKSMVSMVLLYGHGIGGQYPDDISTWKRPVSGQGFHKTMNHHSISYATSYKRIRTRINTGRNLVKPEYTHVPYFKPGVWHKIIVTKKGLKLSMEVENLDSKQKDVYSWDLPRTYNHGRVGFRQMYMYKNLYKDIKISSSGASLTPTLTPTPTNTVTPILTIQDPTPTPTSTPASNINSRYDLDENGVVNLLDLISLIKYIFGSN